MANVTLPNRSPQQEGKIIFFLGAGASIPANVPDTMGLVQGFEKEVESKQETKELDSDLKKLLKVLGKENHPVDIEALLEALDLTEPDDHPAPEAFRAIEKQKELTDINVKKLRDALRKYIVRQVIVRESNIVYLNPLLGFITGSSPLDIFSVNYDTCIELFCHTRRIPFTDGFGVNWRPEEFERKDVKVRLFKLHGSVLWHETTKKDYLRIPVLPQPDQTLTLFTHDEARPLILYPARKWDYSAPLLHNLNQLRERLLDPSVQNVIVVGYSFRDEHIKRLFWDALRANENLILTLIDPQAWKIYDNKLRFYNSDSTVPTGLDERVVCLPYKFEAIFPRLKSHQYIDNIGFAFQEKQRQDEATINGYHTEWNKVLESSLKSEFLGLCRYALSKLDCSRLNSDKILEYYFNLRVLEEIHGCLLVNTDFRDRTAQVFKRIQAEISGPHPSLNFDYRPQKNSQGGVISASYISDSEVLRIVQDALKKAEDMRGLGVVPEQLKIIGQLQSIEKQLTLLQQSGIADYLAKTKGSYRDAAFYLKIDNFHKKYTNIAQNDVKELILEFNQVEQCIFCSLLGFQ